MRHYSVRIIKTQTRIWQKSLCCCCSFPFTLSFQFRSSVIRQTLKYTGEIYMIPPSNLGTFFFHEKTCMIPFTYWSSRFRTVTSSRERIVLLIQGSWELFILFHFFHRWSHISHLIVFPVKQKVRASTLFGVWFMMGHAFPRAWSSGLPCSDTPIYSSYLPERKGSFSIHECGYDCLE